FDEATNAALNRRRAEQYALTGLARHLAKDDRKAELVVTGARVVATERDGKFFVLTLEVPAKGARLVRAGDPAVPEEAGVRVRGLFDSKFFTLKRDLLDTARGVAWSLESSLAQAEKVSDSPLVRVADLEERGDEAFRRLRAAVQKDKLLLLSDELTEVQAEVD